MYKGAIKDFPQEIVEKMLEYQVQQGNQRNVEVFEDFKYANLENKGFNWEETPEGSKFWTEVIDYKFFSLFFEKYPKTKPVYPKVMIVSDKPITNRNSGLKRVVFMEKCGSYLAWNDAETFEKAEKVSQVIAWNYAKDIVEQEIVELTLDDISKGKGVGVDPSLIRIKK